jgi:hypothetical protein
MSTTYEHDDPKFAGQALAEPLPKPSRRGWLSLVLGLLIFAAGLLAGAAAARVALVPRPLASLDEIPARIAGRMQRELGLSDDQRQQLEHIVRSHQPELRRIRARILPQMRAEMRRAIEEMSAVLSPEQAARWRPKAEHSVDVHFPPGRTAGTDG